MALIEIKNVTKRYHKGDETITPLDGVSLDIEAGEFVSLTGASGTGKSTLLNLIATIDKPDSGSIVIDGVEVTSLPRRTLAGWLLNLIATIDKPDSGRIVIDGVEVTSLPRHKLAGWRSANMGYIFQTHNLVPVLTAYENIELPLLLLPMSRAERRKRIEIALRAVDLLDRAEHYPRQLSGGQEQRVGIARSIVAHPKVVVADEPTGDLDPDTSSQILELLQRLNDQLGVTLLMVTHDADAAQIAHRQFRLDRGKLVLTGGRGFEANAVTETQGAAG